jgi:photosystem II stability/assembly factor-like uncharacterized protein
MSHQLSPPVSGYVDRRRGYKSDDESHLVAGGAAFTANAAGTTTTIVGADATLATGINVIRVGDEGKIFNSAGAAKEEKIVRVTGAASSTGTTTVTFTPALLANTASGDNFRPVGSGNVYSNAEMDRRLVQLGFTAARVATMTENDKMYQIRQLDDPSSI